MFKIKKGNLIKIWCIKKVKICKVINELCKDILKINFLINKKKKGKT